MRIDFERLFKLVTLLGMARSSSAIPRSAHWFHSTEFAQECRTVFKERMAA